MKTIKILGTGCPKCKKTIEIVKQVVAENNFDAEVIKVEEIEEIISFNILTTPAVVIDEEVKIKGKVPSKQEIIDAILN